MSDLYTRAFGATVFPFVDRLNGTTIAAKYAELLDGEHLDRAVLARRQEAKLARALEPARRAPFYRKFWATAPAERRLPSLHPLLDGIPVLSKADLAHAAGAFPLPGVGATVASRTSGSTGSPMTFYRCMEQDSWFWALRFRIWHWAGYRPGDPYLTINLNPRLAWRKRVQDVLFRCSYLTYNADNLDARRIVDTLAQQRIAHLNGFSSSLFALARFALEHDLRPPKLVGVTATGDGLYPSYRETVEAAFGVRVLDYYGAGGEGVHLASQCPQSGERYHLLPENALVEILGDDGPAAPGTLGRVVVTQFDNAAMPLIRYELGDVAAAAAADAQCACGRTLPLLERIEGRIPDLVVAPDGAFLVMHFFVVLFKNLQSVHRYQIVQDELAHIRVRLVARAGAERDAIERSVRQAVAEATRNTLACEFEWVDDIPLSGAGKRRLVISRVGARALRGSAADGAAPRAAAAGAPA